MERLISLILFVVFIAATVGPVQAKHFHHKVLSPSSVEISRLVTLETEVFEPEELRESKFQFILSAFFLSPITYHSESLELFYFTQCPPLLVSQGDIFRSTDIPPPTA